MRALEEDIVHNFPRRLNCYDESSLAHGPNLETLPGHHGVNRID